jgi:hypothetical protein
MPFVTMAINLVLHKANSLDSCLRIHGWILSDGSTFKGGHHSVTKRCPGLVTRRGNKAVGKTQPTWREEGRTLGWQSHIWQYLARIKILIICFLFLICQETGGPEVMDLHRGVEEKEDWIKIATDLCGTLGSLSHGAQPFLRSRPFCSNSRASQHFMEPERSLPRSREPSTGPYPKLDQSNPYHTILSL